MSNRVLYCEGFGPWFEECDRIASGTALDREGRVRHVCGRHFDAANFSVLIQEPNAKPSGDTYDYWENERVRGV